MRWLLIALGSLVALVLLATLVGLLLPRNHRVTSSIALAVPPDSVWSAIRDFGSMASWWPDVKRVERLEPAGGRERWREELGGGMALVLQIAEETPPSRLRTVIEDSGEPFGGEWIYQISPAASGSALAITEDGWVSNPLWRFVSKVTGQHRTMDAYLSALAKRFGSASKPKHR